MGETLFTIGGVAVSAGLALTAVAALALAVLIWLAVIAGRAARERGLEAATQAGRAKELEERLAALARIQAGRSAACAR